MAKGVSSPRSRPRQMGREGLYGDQAKGNYGRGAKGGPSAGRGRPMTGGKNIGTGKNPTLFPKKQTSKDLPNRRQNPEY